MTDCSVIRDLMPLYADGQASEATVRLVEAHTAHCPHCRAMLDRMTVPMEPEPEEAHAEFAQLLRKQRRKFTIRVLLVCLAMALVWLVGWWIHMETHFYGETPELITTDRDKILSQMPQLALTDAELELADIIRTLPAVETAIAAGEQTRDVALADVEAEIRPALPGNTEQIRVSVINSAIYLEYDCDELRFSLGYLDPDNNGTVDCIRKLVGVLNKDGRSADTVYLLEYYPILERTYYEKQQLTHMWFSFLDMQ